MAEKQERKSVRDQLAEKFISILESDKPLEWVKGWSSQGLQLPYNGQTGRHYNGINRFVLMLKSLELGYTDPRFYTFKQVSELDGCKIRAGEKAIPVEYWLVWDSKNKRSITFTQYAQLRRDDPSRKEEEFRIYPKTAYVFNAAQVEGLQPLPQKEKVPLEEIRAATASFLKTARSKHCALTMVVQNLVGFDKAVVYDIISNVHFLYVLSSNNTNSLTSEVVCKMAGSYYEKTVSTSEGKGTSHSVSFQEKPVLKPDDLNNLGDDAVLIITNHGYARVKKQGYYCTEPYRTQYEKILAVNQEALADV